MAKHIALPAPGDISIAHEALNHMMDLTRIEAAVAGVLLKHFNRKTGRCDPSVDRIAALLGVGRASVLRATSRLCTGDNRLFEKTSHGGHSHCASYAPRWSVFRAHVTGFEGRMALPTKDLKVSSVRLSESHPCDVEGITSDTETLLINPPYEPYSVQQEAKGAREDVSRGKGSGKKNGLRKDRGWGSSINPKVKPMVVSSPSHAEAKEANALKRWNEQAMALGERAYASIVEWMNDAREVEATEAEKDRPGGGLRYIVDGMRRANG